MSANKHNQTIIDRIRGVPAQECEGGGPDDPNMTHPHSDTGQGDLVERLRARKAFGLFGSHWQMLPQPDSDCQEAATALASLREERDKAIKDKEEIVIEGREVIANHTRSWKGAIEVAEAESASLRERVRVLEEALRGIKNCGDEWGGAACSAEASLALGNRPNEQFA